MGDKDAVTPVKPTADEDAGSRLPRRRGRPPALGPVLQAWADAENAATAARRTKADTTPAVGAVNRVAPKPRVTRAPTSSAVKCCICRNATNAEAERAGSDALRCTVEVSRIVRARTLCCAAAVSQDCEP